MFTNRNLVRPPCKRAHPRARRDRCGFSMILVMLAIAFSLALTYGFMRTQVTSLQMTQNELRRDLALEAARTGISTALLRMQDPDWVGLSDTYAKTTQQDESNLVSCDVTFGTVAPGQVPGVADAELPLHVCITSTGTWTSPRDSATSAVRTIKVVVRLMPRLPGRASRDGDVATATDLATNPANYQATLPFTLTTTSSSSTSLKFDPGTRLEGPVWLKRKLSIFGEEYWSGTIRETMLTEIGNQYGSSTPATFVHPHPMNGPIQFSSSPTGSIQSDLGRLKTPWSTTTQTPSAPALDVNSWLTYRLYDRGPVYQATTLSGSLSHTTLRPSETNPLGVFVRSGNLDVYDDVIVQGTLVATGTVTFWGQDSVVAAYNWISSDGSPAVTDAEKWPRLPAIVAKNLSFSESARQVIEGAVVLDGRLSGGGADFSYSGTNWIDLVGTATAARGHQPFSTVQVQGSTDLSSVSGDQNFAIWLATGTSGRWLPIESVDTQTRRLTVIGEFDSPAAVNFRIRPNRSAFVSLYGPVVAGTASLEKQSMWGIATTVWSNTFSDWKDTNDDLQSRGMPLVTFPDWVSDPANLIDQGWFLPWKTAIYGLRLEPTMSIQPTPGVDYLASAPLFTPYSSTGTDAAAAGYRWKIVDWREDL